MKYQVQIKYTNPSHEHVSFRRRVESVTRLVEASSETEALNRAANQQRALGYMIKEATVMKPEADDKSEYKQKKKKKVVDDNENTEISVENGDIKEGFDTDPKDIAAYLVDRHGKGKVTMDHIEAYERRRDSHRPIEKHEVMKHVKKMSEEVEQIDEMDKSQPSSSRGAEGLATGTKATPVTAKKAAADALKLLKKKVNHVKEEVEAVAEADVTKDLRTSMKMMDLRHGVDADKRDKGYKMSATVRAAQKKFDAQSKGQGKMRPQAGTLAALRKEEVEEIQYIEEKLSASDPAGKWISDFVASDNPKFAGKSKKERINMALGAYYAAKKMKNEEVELEEAVDPGKHRVVNKKVEVKAAADTKKSEKKLKTAEKVMQIAKNKKNPVNVNPVLASNKVDNA
jgi:hypothetical protein